MQQLERLANCIEKHFYQGFLAAYGELVQSVEATC